MILVTGGAGYIGSIVTEMLIAEGYQVGVVDNLQEGHRAAIHPQAQFWEIDLADRERLIDIFTTQPIKAVFHLAAECLVAKSMSEPGSFFWDNVANGLNLLEVMRQQRVQQLIFSSTAAVYGEPQKVPITEGHPLQPINAYGHSKLMFEDILPWYAGAYGLKYVSLRYFNAAGASSRYGEDHRPETHLIPLVLRQALQPRQRGLNVPPGSEEAALQVFGQDYPTPDGSCIRDYIHVQDIARAHLLAFKQLESLPMRVFNLGNGQGYSVLEVIATAQEVTGREIPFEIKERRPGDPAVLVASASRAQEYLGWEPQFPRLREIIASAWRWHQAHPQGYQ